MDAESRSKDGLLARAAGFGLGRVQAGVLAALAVAVAVGPILLLADRGAGVEVRLERDYSLFARLLVALPLLILAAPQIQGVIDKALAHSLSLPILSDEQHMACARWIATLHLLRKSRAIELLILLAAALTSILNPVLPARLIGLEGWGFASDGALKPAGLWYTIVAMTLLRFAILMWCWRIALWTMFLASFAVLRLKPNPAHADGAAGLAYLGFVQQRLAVVLFVGSALLAGIVANRIAHLGESLPEQFPTLVAFALLGPAVLLTPLLLITPTLLRAKRDGIFDYGRIAQDMADAFERNWVRRARPEDAELLESPSPSAMADFAAVHGTVQSMGILPIGKWAIASMILAAVAPLSLLVLLQMPLESILRSALSEVPPFDLVVAAQDEVKAR
ncbi:hypothetical protein L6Q21_08865 [Sandaracinobacter sp. RS1-74]|uniref:hypothetical protein n=1 Tax=Sandaracinobacteroides sayramensis TaxID=2913411 RepID=UPI001EDC4FE0|nr:hypothetical protein [Sandaracinobacteroides sayramensis]MCG2841090.1 hypothetical protein [Sandaracinobacteroides sayramensis]